MAKILQATDALDQARAVNAGLDALADLLASAQESDAPPMKDIAEIVVALHHRLHEHLATAARCLED